MASDGYRRGYVSFAHFLLYYNYILVYHTVILYHSLIKADQLSVNGQDGTKNW